MKREVRNGMKYHWVHQLNPFAMRYPSPAYGLGIPYSFGPVAGGLDDIPGFSNEMRKMPWYTKLRNADSFRAKYDPIMKKSYSKASVIFVAAPYVSDIISSRFSSYSSCFFVNNEHGVDEIFARSKDFFNGEGVIKLLYVGRVVRSKGVRDLVRSLQYVDLSRVILDVVGDGNDLEFCIKEAHELGLSNNVVFHGRLDRTEIDSFYSSSDLMVFPSFREPSGGVVIEAMSHGLPQIVCDYGGPASMVSEGVEGLKIKPSNIENYPSDIASVINSIISNPELLPRFSRNALEKCKVDYLWENKMSKVCSFIEQHRDFH